LEAKVNRSVREEISILLVAANTLFREGLSELLVTDDARLRLVGNTTDAQSQDTIMRLIGDCSPDVVLIVIDSFASGLEEAIRLLLQSFPGTRVVVLTDRSAQTIHRLLALGVRACLAMGVGRQELVAIIRAVTLDPDRVVISIPRNALKWLDTRLGHLLSDRELEILTMAADGASNAQIAEKLYISVGTVKRHLSNIYAKLHVRSRTAAINSAVRGGLIDRYDLPSS
jgi:DNA-binding NarL/FixJ family response regulator